jgi:phosphinothricin acetyltransferase
MAAVIRPVAPSDAAAIAIIYNHYVLNTIVTFEEAPVDAAKIARRIDEIRASYPWLVAIEDDRVVGYGYAGKWKGRCAYRHTVESTVYLAPDAFGRGLGTSLYAALLEDLPLRNVHAVIGGIALPNPASVALHEKFGFRKSGEFKEVGRKFGRWIDVGYWQLTFSPSSSRSLP